MVIRHLTSFVNSIQGASTRESLIKLLAGGTGKESPEQHSRGKPKQLRVAIDGDSLFYYLYMQKVDWITGGDGPSFASAVKSFFDSLEHFDIVPVVFVPPSYINPMSPSAELKKGKVRLQYTVKIANSITKNSGRNLTKSAKAVAFYPLSHYTFIHALRTSKVQFRVTDGPVVPYICAYAKEKNIPVIAYDNIYYACDIPYYIYCDSITFKPNDIQARIIWPSVLLRSLKLSLKQFQLICRLLPSDFYASGVLSPFQDMIFGSFDSTEEQQKGPDVHVQQINALVSYVRDHSNTADDASSDDYSEFFANVQELNAKYYAEHITDYSKQSTTGAGNSDGDRAQDESNNVEELPVTDQKRLIELLHESGRMFDFKDYKNPVKLVIPTERSRYGTQALPDWIETFMRQGFIPPILVFAINFGFMPLPCGVEAVSGSLLGRTSACLLARQLRLFTYSLLGLSRINEQLRYGEDWIEEGLDVPLLSDLAGEYHLLPLTELLTGKDISYLEKFPSLTGPVRRELALLVLLDGDSELLSTLINRFFKPVAAEASDSNLAKASESSPWHTDVFILACIIHMLRRLAEIEKTCERMEADHISVSPEMLAAILTAAYLPLHSDSEQTSPKRSMCQIDLHMLTLVSALQFVYEAALMVNSLFGKPLDVQVTELHRGISYAILYHEEAEEKNSQIRKYNKELVDPNTPFYQSNAYRATEQARQEKNYFIISAQERYICDNVEKYERLRLALTTLSQDVLPNIENATSSSAIAIMKLTDGSYTSECDSQALPVEERFRTVNQGQKSLRNFKKRETPHSFTDLRNNHSNKSRQSIASLRNSKGNDD